MRSVNDGNAFMASHDELSRRRLGIGQELMLAVPPTVTVLLVLWALEIFSAQRLLFASLASSAFLIYRDPGHMMNSSRVLVGAHVSSALLGLLAFRLLGHSYAAAGLAMVTTILVLVTFDLVHPPAISTALTFALRTGSENEVVLFGLAILMILALLVLQRVVVHLAARLGDAIR